MSEADDKEDELLRRAHKLFDGRTPSPPESSGLSVGAWMVIGILLAGLLTALLIAFAPELYRRPR